CIQSIDDYEDLGHVSHIMEESLLKRRVSMISCQQWQLLGHQSHKRLATTNWGRYEIDEENGVGEGRVFPDPASKSQQDRFAHPRLAAEAGLTVLDQPPLKLPDDKVPADHMAAGGFLYRPRREANGFCDPAVLHGAVHHRDKPVVHLQGPVEMT